MAFDGIYEVTSKISPATKAAVASAETAIGQKFPPDYVEFVTRFGEGAISNWVRVYPPERVASEFAELRERRGEYYFWDDGADVLTREQVSGSVLLADTYNGDELIYHPNEPVGLFVLPQEDSVVYSVGATLAEAIDWLCTSGVLTGALSFKSFESERGRARRRFEAKMKGPSYNKVRDALLSLKLHDQANDATEGDDACYGLFVKEFGGVITIVEGSEGAIVGLRTDDGASVTKLDKVIACLEKLGLLESPRDG